MLRLQAARFRAHLEHPYRRGIVDVHARVGQHAHRVRQPAIVRLRKQTGPKTVRVDLRCAGQHPHEELLFRHLEAEHADRPLAIGPDMGADVQSERRLAHRGAGGDDHEIGRLQSRRHLVYIGEPGRHTGNCTLDALKTLDGVEASLGQLA